MGLAWTGRDRKPQPDDLDDAMVLLAWVALVGFLLAGWAWWTA